MIQKHACVVDRAAMLEGEPATEQCVIVADVSFLNNADLDGQALPPPGAPNINCVRQPGTDRHLDSQGDKIMARLVYRNIDGRESIVAVHSVATEVGAGGVRWYEFGVNSDRTVGLRQQGTYAPDGFYRWLATPAIDRRGNIGIGYSFGGTPHYPASASPPA